MLSFFEMKKKIKLENMKREKKKKGKRNCDSITLLSDNIGHVMF